jgi:hypothetical protein
LPDRLQQPSQRCPAEPLQEQQVTALQAQLAAINDKESAP